MQYWYIKKLIIDRIIQDFSYLDYKLFIRGAIFSFLIEYDNPYDILLEYLERSDDMKWLSSVYGAFTGALIEQIIEETETVSMPFDNTIIIDDNCLLKHESINESLNKYDGIAYIADIDEAYAYIHDVLESWLSHHKEYTVLLMDLDNTIFDFDIAEAIAFKNVISRHNIAYSDELFDIYRRINKGLWKDIENGLITKDDLTRMRFTMTFKEASINTDIGPLCGIEFKEELSKVGVYLKGADIAMKELKERYHISIITNGIKNIQLQRIANTDLNKYIDDLFISEEIGYEKPSVHYFEKVIERLDEKDKNRMLVIGDSLSSDIAGAVNADVDAIFINPEYKKTDKRIIASLPSIKYLNLFLNH